MKKLILSVIFVITAGSILNANSVKENELVKTNPNELVTFEEQSCIRECVDFGISQSLLIADAFYDGDRMQAYHDVVETCYELECKKG